MISKTKKILPQAITVLLIFLFILPLTQANDILGIDITVSPNPIPCGGSATVTATIKRAPLNRGQLPLSGIAKLWDYDTGLNNGDDLLDQEHVILISEENTITFTLRCESKDGGCDLYGPSGESYESGTNIFVTFYKAESAKIYVKCQQYDIDGELSFTGDDDITPGDTTTLTLHAIKPIENITTAQLKISYDSTIFEPPTLELIHPALQVKQAEGFFTSIISSDSITLNLTENPIPITLEGPLFNLQLITKPTPSLQWDTTTIRVDDETSFYNELDEKINVCLGGNHSIFIIPTDTTPPELNHSRITTTQGKIEGTTGAITDDLDRYEHYLTIALYDHTNTLIAKDFVNSDGSFKLDQFFWLDPTATAQLIAYNGVNQSLTYTFTPTPTAIPYLQQPDQTSQQNTTGKPGETIQLSFDVLGNSDTTQTYDITISNTAAWNIEQASFTLELGPMETTSLPINITIPTTATNGTTNDITVTISSQTYPENTDTETVTISVYGTYESAPPTTQTPGFELGLLIIVLIIGILLVKRKQRKL